MNSNAYEAATLGLSPAKERASAFWAMTDKLKKVILQTIFQKIPTENCIVFLFGSQAQGEALRGSDIDIGILGLYKISPKDFLEIEEEINTELPTLKKIDLVDFSTVDKKVKEEALKEIKIWHIGKNCRGLLKNLKPA